MQINTVTFCAMDGEAGANILWHSCILLSTYDSVTKKMEVVDQWGFYGLPTTNTASIIRPLKTKIGLDVDLAGNHGMLLHEEVRYLDLGCGLNGVTFDLSPEKFQMLQEKCNKMAREQDEAIADVIKPLNLTAAEKAKPRIYPYEDLSPSIFAIEKLKAKLEHRESRLKSFKLTCGGARNCKVQMIELLDGILTPEQIARVNGYSASIPRLSGKLEKIYLHSTGPTRTHVKSSGKTVSYRDQKLDSNVKLYWTLPPQELETTSDETRRLFAIRNANVDAIKKVISQLQKLEWFFMNATVDSKHEKYRTELLELIHDTYEVFATIEPKIESRISLFSHPGTSEAQTLMDDFDNADFLLNSLYMAIVDGWELDEESDDPDVEALAAYLPEDEKWQVCDILGRSYVKAEQSLKMV